MVRRAKSSDMPAILDFVRETYGPGAPFKDAKRLAWQFEHTPFRTDKTDDPSIWIAVERGRVVGTIGVQDDVVWIDDDKIEAGWIVDVMVRSDWRGMGLGHRIHDAVMRDRTTLVTLTMAPATRRIAERAGALTLGPTWQFILPARTSSYTVARFLRHKSANRPRAARFLSLFAGSGLGPASVALASRTLAKLAASRRPKPVLARFEVDEVSRFPNEVDVFWANVRTEFPAVFDRSVAALNWRFCDCPGLDYRRFLLRRKGVLCGLLITRLGVEEELSLGVIVDLLTSPRDTEALDALIELARNVLLPAREYIEAAASTPVFAQALRRHGFVRIRTMRPTLVCSDSACRTKFADHINDWHFTKGDHDWDQVHPV